MAPPVCGSCGGPIAYSAQQSEGKALGPMPFRGGGGRGGGGISQSYLDRFHRRRNPPAQRPNPPPADPADPAGDDTEEYSESSIDASHAGTPPKKSAI